MRRERQLRGSWTVRYWLLGAATVAVLAPFVSAYWVISSMMRGFDYDHRKPAEVFEQYVRRPVPVGVTHLRLAGTGSLGGSNIWMRFQATDAALRQITTGMAGGRTSPSLFEMMSVRLNDPHLGPHAARIRFRDVLRIPPSATSYGFGQPGAFQGTLIWEPRTHSGFVEIVTF